VLWSLFSDEELEATEPAQLAGGVLFEKKGRS